MEGDRRFCTNCGNELNLDARFCTNCGEKVERDETSELADAAGVTPASGSFTYEPDTSGIDAIGADPFGSTGGYGAGSAPDVTRPLNTVNTDHTVQMGTLGMDGSGMGDASGVSPVAGTPDSAIGGSGKSRGKRPKSFYALIVVAIVAVAAIALLVVLWVVPTFFGGSSQQDDASSSVTESADSSSTSTTSNGEPTVSGTADSSNYAYYYDDDDGNRVYGNEQQFYDLLSLYYDRLSDYDSQISQVATDFNNNYTNSSYSVRESYADVADELEDAIEDDYDFLFEIYPSTYSVNYDVYYDIYQCYYDCLMRIDVINQAWDRSLEYSNPSDHTDYIIEPLAEARDGGVNIYKDEFETLYPTCSPVQP